MAYRFARKSRESRSSYDEDRREEARHLRFDCIGQACERVYDGSRGAKFHRQISARSGRDPPAVDDDYAALGVRRGGTTRAVARCEQYARLHAAVNYD